MQCRRIENLLSAYLDGELDDDEAWAVQAHLDRCAACRAEFAALNDTKQALAALARRTPREDIDRLLQTDVGEVARRVANYPVSPRTIGAALLSLVGLWAASVQLAQNDDHNGPPLPESAYLPILGPRQSAYVLVDGPGACSLLVAPAPPVVPASLAGPGAPPPGTFPAAFGPSGRTAPRLVEYSYTVSVAFPERR